eukprot:403376585
MLNETFQNTVRKQIYSEDGDDQGQDQIFKTARQCDDDEEFEKFENQNQEFRLSKVPNNNRYILDQSELKDATGNNTNNQIYPNANMRNFQQQNFVSDPVEQKVNNFLPQSHLTKPYLQQQNQSNQLSSNQPQIQVKQQAQVISNNRTQVQPFQDPNKRPLENFMSSDMIKSHSKFLGYFEVRDIMALSQVSSKLYSTVIDRKIIKRLVRYGCMDDQLRKAFWRKLCQYDELEDALRDQLNLEDENQNVYQHLQQIIKIESEDKSIPETSRKLSSKVIEEVSKDLKRTHTSALMKTEVGWEQLRRVLLAIGYVVPEVGYCQGMNFIASVLITVLENEEQAFWAFLEMLITRDMKTLFLPGVPELHLKNFQMAQLIKFHMPKLFSHLRQIQMTTDYFTSKWIMTLFACFLPYEVLPHIFDMFLMDGWTAVFRIGIALLKEMEPLLMQMDMVDMCTYFRDNVRKDKLANQFKLFSEASRIRVNQILIHNRELQKLREQFYIIQAEVKLKQGRKSWTTDQADALKWAETVFEKMDPHAKEDIQKFQQKLENIDKELDKTNKLVLASHVDFYAIKDEYTSLVDKKHAYEQAYSCLSEQLKLRKQGKSWKIKRLISQTKNNYFNLVSKSGKKKDVKSTRTQSIIPSNIVTNNLHSNNAQPSVESPTKLPLDDKYKDVTDLKQLERDLQDLHDKMVEVQAQIDLIKDEYSYKKTRYHDSKMKMDESRNYKEKVKTQMNGFLIMYEVKREETLKELSKKLQNSEKYKQERVF